MTSARGGDIAGALRLETGPYILRSLIHDVALSADADDKDVTITCVEAWSMSGALACKHKLTDNWIGDNLYIGTSAGEILHYFQIPSETNDTPPQYIVASRQQPPVKQPGEAGIQQILLLPSVSKACVLSNNTLSFYSLPELTPAFPQLKPLTCGWVGGVDLNSSEGQDGVIIVMCLKNRISLVRVSEEKGPVKIRDIEFGGCLGIARRGDEACVADARSYALLDVVQQQKIPLFPISSADDQSAETAGTSGIADDAFPDSGGKAERSFSIAGTVASRLSGEERGHGRSTSLGIFKAGHDSDSSRPTSSRYGFDAPPTLPQQPSPRPLSFHAGQSNQSPDRADKPLPTPPPGAQSEQPSAQASPTKTFPTLKPLIASPSENEFLLTTGTDPNEPGVGMFVNLDGDVVRGTIEFTTYPDYLVVDGAGIDLPASTNPDAPVEEGYVLAVVKHHTSGTSGKDVEIQRWDDDPGEGAAPKEWLGVASPIHGLLELGGQSPASLGIRSITGKADISIPEIVKKIALTRVDIHQNMKSKDSSKREKEEAHLISRLCTIQAHIVLWANAQVYWMLRNPLLIQLDARLRLAQSTSIEEDAEIHPQRSLVEALLGDIRGLKSRNELEFFSLGYIKQKAALLLFMDLLLRTSSAIIVHEKEKRVAEDALLESETDPRIVLSFLPGIRDEIVQGEDGVWIPGGLKELVHRFNRQLEAINLPTDPEGAFGDNLLQPITHYLIFWRRKKGNPSVADGAHVFPSVDAALLRILLLLDTNTHPGPAAPGSIRAELNNVVDTGVDCFDRAVALLEEHKRLYVLSRLYQSRRSYPKVLETWRRIISGEQDLGGEFLDGELEMRKYLTKSKRKLIEEYGTWLAARNPKLGVQVFADDTAKVKLEPAEALSILRSKAPNAVKEYLEYLVFGKKQSQHINELIAYYLDIVISELSSNPNTRALLAQTYSAYRALRPPKPTYRNFITDNALDAEWYQARLRLLQLLGSTQDASKSYDVASILSRLEPFEEELVPEMIILNGRQGRHEEALRLLVHGLGDFDTAISYCLLGGSSIFRPTDFERAALPSHEQQAKLFGYLLTEFLRIEDLSDRIERTGELLERFGGWFDASDVLGLIPDDWGLDIFAGFLVSALRRLVRERMETRVHRALSSAQNLRASKEWVERCEELGSVVEGVG